MSMGGKTHREFIKRAMDSLMSQELLSQFNRTGRKGKFSFKGVVEDIIIGKYILITIYDYKN